MCHEFDSQFFRARVFEALRRKAKTTDELSEPAAVVPSAAPPDPVVPVMKPESVPA